MDARVRDAEPPSVTSRFWLTAQVNLCAITVIGGVLGDPVAILIAKVHSIGLQ